MKRALADSLCEYVKGHRKARPVQVSAPVSSPYIISECPLAVWEMRSGCSTTVCLLLSLTASATKGNLSHPLCIICLPETKTNNMHNWNGSDINLVILWVTAMKHFNYAPLSNTVRRKALQSLQKRMISWFKIIYLTQNFYH